MVEKIGFEQASAEEHNFIESMKALREKRGWSQTEFARRMVEAGWDNYTQMTVSRTEKHDRPLRLSEARAISRLLDSRLEVMIAPPLEHALIQELAGTVGRIRMLRQRLQDTMSSMENEQIWLEESVKTFKKMKPSEWSTDDLKEQASKLIVLAEQQLVSDPRQLIYELIRDGHGVDQETP